MGAVLTLLASLVIAVFFIGPSVLARFAIEWLVVKQPSKAQTSTEELARSLFFSIRFVLTASLLVWLFCRNHYTFDPSVLDTVFASDKDFRSRWQAMHGLWPIRSVLIWTYVEVTAYVVGVKLAAYLLPRVPPSDKRVSRSYLLRAIMSPYLRSEWDVLAGKLLLLSGTIVLADVATKSGKIFLGTLAGVTTNADGSLRHLQLKSPSIRAKRSSDSSDIAGPKEDYLFQDSFYFVVLATDITDVNLRFERPTYAIKAAVVMPETLPGIVGLGRTQPVREHSLEEELTGLGAAERKLLQEQLKQSAGPPNP